jgi:hypothetical protein
MGTLFALKMFIQETYREWKYRNVKSCMDCFHFIRTYQNDINKYYCELSDEQIITVKINCPHWR